MRQLPLLLPANEVWGKVIFSRAYVILFTGGVCMVWGMHDREGACMAGRHAWQVACMVEACMVAACMVGGVCGRGVCVVGHSRGHVWWRHVWQGVCVVVWWTACVVGGHAWRGCAWQGGGIHGSRDGHCSRRCAPY